MASPNLFEFATKELSQDAVICWLIAWADANATEGPTDAGLRQCGREFVDALFATWEEDWGKVELGGRIRTNVQRQEKRIDVLACVDGQYVLLIEDKTDTGAHGDQLDRYRETVLNGETVFGDVSDDDLFPIYVKTGNHSLTERHHAEDQGYAVFDRTDFLHVLDTYDGPNSILLDFRDHLRQWQRETDSFRSWTESTLACRDAKDGPSPPGLARSLPPPRRGRHGQQRRRMGTDRQHADGRLRGDLHRTLRNKQEQPVRSLGPGGYDQFSPLRCETETQDVSDRDES